MLDNKEELDFVSFSTILDKVRKLANKKRYNCCIPNCKEKALHHSHIIPQSVLKKYICDDNNKVVQCQIDKVNPLSVIETGILPNEKFTSVGVSEAMSMPIFCKYHDNELFLQYEKDADSIEPYDVKFQMLQALRAIGTYRHHYENLLSQNNIKAEKDDFYSGGIYGEEKQTYKNIIKRCDSTITSLFNDIQNNNYSTYNFVCIELEQIKLAICDVFIDEEDLYDNIEYDECDLPLKALYLNLVPKGNHSYLFIGYDERCVSEYQIIKMNEWIEILKTRVDIKVLYDILCHTRNNWCYSPNCDNRITEFLSNNYFEDPIDMF